MAWLRRFVADQCEKTADSFGGKALYVDTKAGELRMQISGVVMFIDAEDGQFPWYGNGTCFKGPAYLWCQRLVADNDGGRTP